MGCAGAGTLRDVDQDPNQRVNTCLRDLKAVEDKAQLTGNLLGRGACEGRERG